MGQAVGIGVPQTVDLEVIETEPGLKSATASSVTKTGQLETGLVVQVPAFINAGEKIRVDTSEGAYMSRRQPTHHPTTTPTTPPIPHTHHQNNQTPNHNNTTPPQPPNPTPPTPNPPHPPHPTPPHPPPPQHPPPHNPPHQPPPPTPQKPKTKYPKKTPPPKPKHEPALNHTSPTTKNNKPAKPGPITGQTLNHHNHRPTQAYTQEPHPLQPTQPPHPLPPHPHPASTKRSSPHPPTPPTPPPQPPNTPPPPPTKTPPPTPPPAHQPEGPMPIPSVVASAAENYRFNSRFLKQTVSDLSPDEWLKRPGDSTNHITWIVGHMALCRSRVLPFMGAEWTQPALEIFGRGAKLQEDSACRRRSRCSASGARLATPWLLHLKMSMRTCSRSLRLRALPASMATSAVSSSSWPSTRLTTSVKPRICATGWGTRAVMG